MATSFENRLGSAPEEGIKAPCVASTTANITLSGEQTIDGIAAVAGNRVLVRSQTDATENGIYDVATSAWTRAKDFNNANDVVNGVLVLDVNSSIVYQSVFTGSYSPGITSLAFGQLDYGAALADHLSDAEDAHAASAISNTPAGNIAAITAQAAINELDTKKTAITDLASTDNGKGASLGGIEDSQGMYSGNDIEEVLAEIKTKTYANRATAILNDPVNGALYFFGGTDGGHHIGVTGAALGTYLNNGAPYCGTVSIPTGGDGSKAYLRDYSGVINAAMFGITGSGDETTKVQLLVDYLVAQGLTDVEFNKGVYTVTALTGYSTINFIGEEASFDGISIEIKKGGSRIS